MEWKTLKLGEIANVTSGGTPSRSNRAFWQDGTIPWLTIGDFHDYQTVLDTTEKITEIGLKESSAKLFPKGTVIVTIFATLGRVGILGKEMATNQAIAGVFPAENIDGRYLMYAIQVCIQKATSVAVGVAQKNINLTILKDVSIPFPFRDGKPDIVEQKRIAERLDKIFSEVEIGKAKVEKQLNHFDNLKTSVLSSIFTTN